MILKRIISITVVTGLILLIPLVLTLNGSGVDGVGFHWTLFDFVVAGVLIFGTGLAYELVAQRGNNRAYKAAVGMALAAMFFLLWVNGAVGIIGNEDNPANLLYFGVIAVLLIGVFIARFRAHEMSYALFATAIAHILVPVIAFMIWRPDFSPGVVGIFVLNTMFALLWVGSGILFRKSQLH